MWEILGEGMLGYVLLLDANRPDSLEEAVGILDAFRRMARVPFVVALNRTDRRRRGRGGPDPPDARRRTARCRSCRATPPTRSRSRPSCWRCSTRSWTRSKRRPQASDAERNTHALALPPLARGPEGATRRGTPSGRTRRRRCVWRARPRRPEATPLPVPMRPGTGAGPDRRSAGSPPASGVHLGFADGSGHRARRWRPAGQRLPGGGPNPGRRLSGHRRRRFAQDGQPSADLVQDIGAGGDSPLWGNTRGAAEGGGRWREAAGRHPVAGRTGHRGPALRCVPRAQGAGQGARVGSSSTRVSSPSRSWWPRWPSRSGWSSSTSATTRSTEASSPGSREPSAASTPPCRCGSTTRASCCSPWPTRPTSSRSTTSGRSPASRFARSSRRAPTSSGAIDRYFRADSDIDDLTAVMHGDEDEEDLVGPQGGRRGRPDRQVRQPADHARRSRTAPPTSTSSRASTRWSFGTASTACCTR